MTDHKSSALWTGPIRLHECSLRPGQDLLVLTDGRWTRRTYAGCDRAALRFWMEGAPAGPFGRDELQHPPPSSTADEQVPLGGACGRFEGVGRWPKVRGLRKCKTCGRAAADHREWVEAEARHAAAPARFGAPAPMSGAEARRLREELGVSQAELAKRLDCARSTVSNWECGWRMAVPDHVATWLRDAAAAGSSKEAGEQR